MPMVGYHPTLHMTPAEPSALQDSAPERTEDAYVAEANFATVQWSPNDMLSVDAMTWANAGSQYPTPSLGLVNQFPAQGGDAPIKAEVGSPVVESDMAPPAATTLSFDYGPCHSSSSPPRITSRVLYSALGLMYPGPQF